MYANSQLSEESGTRRSHDDDPRPINRPHAPLPLPRVTRYVDLSKGEDVTDLLRVLYEKTKIVVVAGAGISVSAGIPDFRSSTGLFASLRGQHGVRGSGKALFDASVYNDASSTSTFHSIVRQLAHMTRDAQPTPFHHMLASIAHEGRLMRLYSQNIDCIDTKMPPLATHVPLNKNGPWPTTVQLHGGISKMVCATCGHLEDLDGSLFNGPRPPPCSQCTETDNKRVVAGKRSHGIGRLRPRIVLYNEYNPDGEAIGNVLAADRHRGANAVIVVGTSLQIPGVRRLVRELCEGTRRRRGGFTAWINVDAAPKSAEFNGLWDVIVSGSSDAVAKRAAFPRWDEQDMSRDLTERLEVVLEDKPPYSFLP